MKPTPLLPVGIGRYLKAENYTPSYSMKYRSARRILEEARLSEDVQVIESTSGNMGVALAVVCRELGLAPPICVVDPKLAPWHQREMEVRDCKLVEVREVDKTGGWLLTRLAQVRRIMESGKAGKMFWPNQYANPLNPIAFETVAIEIVEQLRTEFGYGREHHGDRLWLFAAVSTGGSLSGIARALRRLWGEVRVVAVDAEGSQIFGRPARPRHLNGIGSSLRHLPNLQRSLIDDVVIVTDEQAFRAAWELARGELALGFGGSSGAVWAAMGQRSPLFGTADIVVGICPDDAGIYDETIYNVDWLNARGFHSEHWHVG